MLRRFRRTSGLSQAALAERAGLSSEAVSLLERNLRTPRATTLTLLADALALGAEDRDLFFAVSTPQPPLTYAVPQYLDRFFGRAAEIQALVSQLRPDGARLVTLTGPGGVGKTRLAAVVMGPDAGASPVRWLHVSSDTTEPEFVAVLAAALGVPASAGASLTSVVEAVRLAPSSVLVLDQADALLSMVSRACELMLTRTQLKLVVISRQRLHLGAEVVIPVTPLPLPPAAAAGRPVELTSDATRLFVDRCRAVLPATPSPPSVQDEAATAWICRRVDGLPLAIELAAALTSVLSVVELASALDESLHVLSPPDDGTSGGLTRHLVGDLYPRLGPDEQVLLGRLAVFSGPFDVAAALALHGSTPDQGHVLGVLASLVSRSLVLRQEAPAGTTTFSLLEVVREFAAARLHESPDADVIRRRHAHHFRDAARAAGARLGDRGSPVAAARLEAEAAEIRTAFAWCLDHDPPSSLALVASLWPWWHEGGHYREGRCRTSAALQADPLAPVHLKAPAFAAAGLFALLQSDYDDAQWHIQQGLDAYSAAEDG
ncbi:MAG: helix-turn-helix domain-containing protein, partial [Propionibacteriaceae bacterium]